MTPPTYGELCDLLRDYAAAIRHDEATWRTVPLAPGEHLRDVIAVQEAKDRADAAHQALLTAFLRADEATRRGL